MSDSILASLVTVGILALLAVWVPLLETLAMLRQSMPPRAEDGYREPHPAHRQRETAGRRSLA